MTNASHIAIIGAGIAGLACATTLRQAGLQVSLFEKSRGAGGRMSTRRGDGWQCDHGAQYFTARNPAFRAEVTRWEQAGVAGQWQLQLPSTAADGASGSDDTPAQRFVGMPRMSSIASWLAADLPLHTGVAISALQREDSAWRLQAQDAQPLADRYDAVVLAVPAPQAVPLLRQVAPEQAALAAGTTMAGCWAMMLEYAQPLALGFNAAFINAGPLRWVARDSTKPGRNGHESWLLHASAEWSEAHMELDGDSIAAQLLASFISMGGQVPQRWSVHRWRYASTPQARNDVCVWEAAQRLGMCGDWLNGGTVEAAWLSGQALAQRIVARPA
ncbi:MULTISPECIES: FAD-dependent oxidoreductase [unclassified Janthinobacterium]|uniref:NAD(P)/FAD-dependent oxidoreductase n=1 Tax=unclassified Janthinobacterium TaxID=2610881 RepID=UPI0018CAE164|nr:FAD-dependent oxidoreductase [Janthinobacterium sp. CG_23.4]MDH6158761.1 putative NAD/FAD-dependent oxidoreductase [Janthinobacterium sp. CG_23.4]